VKEARPETRAPCQGEPRSFGFESISSTNETKTRRWRVKALPAGTLIRIQASPRFIQTNLTWRFSNRSAWTGEVNSAQWDG